MLVVEALQDVSVQHVHLLQNPLAGHDDVGVSVGIPLVYLQDVGDLEDELVAGGVGEIWYVAVFVLVEFGEEGLPDGQGLGHPLVERLEGESGEAV